MWRGVLALALGMAVVVPTTAAAMPGKDLGKRMDEALERAASQFGDAGVQAVAIHNGRVVWSGKRGKAINDPAKRVTSQTMFTYASLSKLILTTFVLHQVEKGVLDLDKPISAYVGDEVAGSRVVTVRMLLTHTGGYPELYGDPATASLFPPGDQYKPDRPYTFKALNAGIRQPVDPGKKFEYSNTGYIILGHVLAKTAGGDEALVRAHRNFLRRAGTPQVPMTDDIVTMERTQRALNRFAHGYTRREDGTLEDYFTAYGATGIPTDLYGLPFTDGAFAGTATGAGLVLDAVFARGTLLRPETVQMMVKPSPQSGDTPYGMGTSQRTVATRTWQGHGGTYGGFTSMAATDRARGLTIAVTTNHHRLDKHPATVIWEELAKTASTRR
ncbi:hypothetical protein ALI144C_06445 [Actinosynnema sp. ALI-1.44]|nr:hypothetical protein ALI144C_06445 [Actinosynnema sp. ALI-1.44]